MPDMSLTRVPMPEQAPEARTGNFSEVALGYDAEMAVREAGRCLNCKNMPCVKGCPVNVDIPGFIGCVARREFDRAYEILYSANALPAICGRVCPQENQCEKLCVRGLKGEPVAVGRLERYAADRKMGIAADAGVTSGAAAGVTTNAGTTGSASNGAAPADVNASYNGAAPPDAGAAGVTSGAAAGVTTNAGTTGSASNGAAPADVNASYNGAAPIKKSASYNDAALKINNASLARAPCDGRKAAVVGSGPASLTCAGELAKRGYRVKIFESLHAAGGVLTYGIPEFRLPKEYVRREIGLLLASGVEIAYDTIVGMTVSIDDLFADGFEAVFIGTGAGLPQLLNIPGENLCGVFTANEYLTRVNLMQAYNFPQADTPVIRGNDVVVIGGGNVAVDAARCAKRLGAENVHIVYRRTENEMPARVEEIHHARQEGVRFQLLANPLRVIGDGDGWARAAEFLRMELGEPDASGRRRPVPVKGSEFQIETDLFIIAIGQNPNPIIGNATPALKREPWGGIITDAGTCATSIEGVYAGGDVVTGAATVIEAMGAGKIAAASIDKYLQKKF